MTWSCAVGALRDGWEASVARTLVVGSAARPNSRIRRGWDALFAACKPGTTVGASRARGAVLYGVGRGVEPWDDDVPLDGGDDLPRSRSPVPRACARTLCASPTANPNCSPKHHALRVVPPG